MLLLSILYQLVRLLLGLTAVLVRRDLSKDAELLVLRHENTVVRDRSPGFATGPSTGHGWPLCPGSCQVAAEPRSSRSLLPRSWLGTASWSRGEGTTRRVADPGVPRPQQRSKDW
jgi:hypothetical protein